MGCICLATKFDFHIKFTQQQCRPCINPCNQHNNVSLPYARQGSPEKSPHDFKIQAFRAIEHNALLRKSFRQILRCLCFAGSSWSGRCSP